MEYRRLGRSNLTVSRLCFGSLTVGPLQAALETDRGAEVLAYGLSRGINFIDTAQYYQNYEILRRALRKSGKFDTILCTKTYAYNRPLAEQAFEEARRALDRDVIDLFMLHEQESIHTLRGHAEALDFLIEMKHRGYIRALGVSTHHVAAVEGVCDLCAIRELDVIFPIYNMRGLGIADGTIDDMNAALYRAKRLRLGIFAMKALGGGNLHASAAEALRFVLDARTPDGAPLCDSIAIGMQSEEEIDANIGFFETGAFSESARQALAQKHRVLHIEDYCEGCGSCVRRCGQHALTIRDGRCVCDASRCVLCGYCAAVCPLFAIKVL